MAEQVNFFLDQTDDPLLPDQIPAFDGGQFSNVRANLLQPNQSKLLFNCDIDKLGKIRTRRGTSLIGPKPDPRPDPSAATTGTPIQGLTSYQTHTDNYIVAAHNKRLWAFVKTTEFNGAWVRIGLGGTADDEEIFIARTGLVNLAAGYPMGTLTFAVDTLSGAGVIAVGEKLYFNTNIRTDYYEYTVAAVSGGPPVTAITLEEPGLVFAIKDNWKFTVLRPAKVNHPTPGNRYAGGAGTGATGIDITVAAGFGAVGTGEKFVIKSENITHTITTHTETGGDTTHVNFSTDLQASWISPGSATDHVIFAQGNDSLFFTDGTGAIFAWTGGIPNVAGTTGGGTLMKIGSHSLLDELAGNFIMSGTAPPQNVSILIWFQNRLIASGISTEPDAIYFSDYFDPSSWDNNYQKVRIGGGESDPITGLLAWTDYNMLVFKKNSIYVVNCDPGQNPDPNDPTLLVASFSVKQLHKLIGCPAPFTAQQVGGGSTTPGSDIFFLDGDKKVHSIRRVMAAETQQEVGQAMSLPVQDGFDIVNRDEIDSAVAMYHNEHYIIGLPVTQFAGGGANGPNIVAAYNLLTQSWCGGWNWSPTCFARRTDLGQYSKLIFGDATGVVQQWMDDLSLDEETPTTYMDKVFHDGSGGVDIATTIWTRAITFGDLFSHKTGLNVEFEFDESEAEDVAVKVVLDKKPQIQLIAYSDPNNPSGTFSSLSNIRVRLPFRLPVVLPGSPDLLRKAFDLQRYGTWRELQFYINSDSQKLAIRSIRVTGFMDTLQLQTLPPEPPPLGTTYILAGPDGGPSGVTSDTFVVQLDGAVESVVTVTPDDAGAGGVFVPTSIVLTTGVPGGLFTYFPVTAGPKTISTTNDAALIDPDALTYTAV